MRGVNRVATALLGLVLIVVGLLAAAEALLAYAGRRPLLPLRDWYARAVSTSYNDRIVLLVAIGIGIVGLVILIAQLRPLRPDQLELLPDDTSRWSLQRLSLEQQIAMAVAAIPGVGSPQVEASGNRSDWRVRVRATGRPDHRALVQEKAREALTRLEAPQNVDLRVDLRAPRRVS